MRRPLPAVPAGLVAAGPLEMDAVALVDLETVGHGILDGGVDLQSLGGGGRGRGGDDQRMGRKGGQAWRGWVGWAVRARNSTAPEKLRREGDEDDERN